MSNLTKINLHGSIGEAVGRTEWELKVRSAAEALHAINLQSGEALKRYFFKTENAYGRFKVLLNGEEIPYPEQKLLNREETDLTIQRDDIDTLDIIPVLEGAGWLEWLGLGLGLLGLWNAESSFSAMLSILLITTAISNMLSQPPDMPEEQMIQNPSSDPTALADSYLFSGPVNTLNEGGPVPLGYGRLVVGSQTVMSSYDVKYVLVDEAGAVI